MLILGCSILALLSAGCQVLSYTAPTGDRFSRSSLGANTSIQSLAFECQALTVSAEWSCAVTTTTTARPFGTLFNEIITPRPPQAGTAAGNIRFDGEADDSHCDRTWALALCQHASKTRFVLTARLG